MQVNENFQKNIIGVFGEEGAAWLKTLDKSVENVLQKWNLLSNGPVNNLSYNFVLKVEDANGRPCILKLGVPGFDFSNEVITVQTYKGEGCATLIKAEPEEGAMLLEQLRPGMMLHELQNEEEITKQYMQVWKAIRRPLPKAYNYPTIADWKKTFQEYLDKYEKNEGPIPIHYITIAEQFYVEVVSTSKGMELLHGDLHHENILYDEIRGWLAIDPKGVGGDPYFDFAAFLYNHLFSKKNPKEILKYRVETICNQLQLQKERFLKAAVVMTMISACWSIDDQNDGWKETLQCVKWFLEFINH